MSENRVERRTGGWAKSPSLLAGLLRDDKGDPMTPSYAVKNGKRYRYYVCLANSYYVYKSPLFHRLVNPGGNGTIWVHA